MRAFGYVMIGLLFFSVLGWSQSDDNQTQAKVAREDYARLRAAVDSKNELGVIQVASRILSRDPKDLKALSGLGFFYFSTGKLGMAKLIYRRALKDYSDEPGLYNNLGVIQLAEGDLRKAIISFKKSISLNSSYEMAATNLGSIFVFHKDYGRALAPLASRYKSVKSKLSSRNKLAIEIANNYAVALMGTGQGKKAERVFKEALGADVLDASMLYNYAILLVNVMKKRGDALRIISKLKFSSDDPKILHKAEELEQRLDKL